MTIQPHPPDTQPPDPGNGTVAGLIDSIGTFLTFTGTVTESTWLPGFQRGTSNRRLRLEDHGVRVTTIVGSGWATDIQAGDQLTLRGPIKGYQIGPDGITIVLAKTRPLHHATEDPDHAIQLPTWPPTATAGARRRYRSQHSALLRPGKTPRPSTPPEALDGKA